MKQNLSPVMTAAIIAIVIIALGFIGYRTIGRSTQSSGKPPPEAQKWLNPGSQGHVMGAKSGSGRSPQMGRPGGMGNAPPGAYGGGYGAPATGPYSAPR